MTACGSKRDLQKEFDEVFADDGFEESFRDNNFSKYLEYYVPSDVFQCDSNDMSYVFDYNDSRLIMNVNVSGIINRDYYDTKITSEGFFDKNALVYSHSGVFLGNDGKESEYLCEIYQYDLQYLIYFNCQDIIMYAYTYKSDVVALCSRILLMAKTVNVKQDAIIADYSNKDVVDYRKQQINLFESVLPVNGRIDDMMVDDKNASSQ